MRRNKATGLLLVLFAMVVCPALAVPYDIIDAAKRGDDHAVRKLLEKDPSLAHVKDTSGYTALDWAAFRGHWVILRHLIEAGAPVNSIGADGGTSMHRVCHHGRADMVQLLLENGADLAPSNQWGRVPLHVAVRRGHRAPAELLLTAGADPNVTTREGWTPLHVAYMAGQSDLVELLLERGADPGKKDSEGKRPEDHAFTRPAPIDLTMQALDEYVGHYDLGHGYGFKIWREEDGLHIREFAPDRLYPIGKDEFYCVQEPWRVTFLRDDSGAVTSVDVAFLRRTVRAQLLDHPRYVGADACRECHYEGAHGGEYMQWVTSRHAAAYWRLKTDWAELLASLRPAYQDVTHPAEDDRCLLCHLTSAQDPDALLSDGFRMEEGIGCETCHGPGSAYMDEEIMSDRELFLANGGIVPDEKTCQKCHRNADRFDFASWWPRIDHKRTPDSQSEIH